MSITNKLPISFLFQELIDNPADRERFNKLQQNIEVRYDEDNKELLFHIWISGSFSDYSDTFTANTILENPFDLITEKIIRTCLSCVQTKKTCKECGGTGGWTNRFDHLSQDICTVCQGDTFNISTTTVIEYLQGMTYLYYPEFDEPLSDGFSLTYALENLHNKMLQVSYKYKKFIENTE
jgi:hypothetical protein